MISALVYGLHITRELCTVFSVKTYEFYEQLASGSCSCWLSPGETGHNDGAVPKISL